jgi:putative Mg2+ transporter-C (MgtC) family protein
MDVDVAQALDVVARLLLAAVLGAVVGLEREIHDHPAGMRTHLLVSVGSAGFTVLSIYAFQAPGADPARIAAQIVTGVGFLGAGAILKEGATVRGLTTAASLWAVAAVGMAAGAGSLIVALAVTFIVVVSLWPLRRVTDRFVDRDQHRVRLVLATDLHGLSRIVEAIGEAGGTIAHLATTRELDQRLRVDTEVRTRDVAHGASLTGAVGGMEGVELVESQALGD